MEELAAIRVTYARLVRARAHLNHGCFILADATNLAPIGLGLEDRLQRAILDTREGITALTDAMHAIADNWQLKTEHPGKEKTRDPDLQGNR